jgi:hypothetical protein
MHMTGMAYSEILELDLKVLFRLVEEAYALHRRLNPAPQ